jgi:hypothetical protein
MKPECWVRSGSFTTAGASRSGAPRPILHFLTALLQAAELPHRPEQAHTARWYGQMLLERDKPGDHEQAEKVLRQAVERYERMGMPRHRELAFALLSAP